VAITLACVLRAGVVARERVTAALAGRAEAERAAGFREVRDEVLLGRVVRLGTGLLADREGVGLRDEDFTDYSPGMTAMVRYYLRSTSRTAV
jgi:hypothetical protein